MKCIHCDKEVSMWATVCPHCYRDPGNFFENAVVRLIRWIFILGFIGYGIAYLFTGGSIDKSTQPKQHVKTQQQTTRQIQQTEKINTTESSEYENRTHQETYKQEAKQEQERKEAENALF